METIVLKPTEVSPEVIINPVEKKYLISGWSRPESPAKFYLPIINWIDMYGEKNLGGTTFEFKIEYFNTPSARILREILDRLDKLYRKGVNLKVNWHFDDEGAKEEFESEFAHGISMPIKFIDNY